MRTPQRQGTKGAVRSLTSSLPPPVAGLNARDSVADMKPEDAILLDNWFPLATEVKVRDGYSSFATFTGDCESVVVYNGVTATKIFVCVNTTNDLSQLYGINIALEFSNLGELIQLIKDFQL